MINKSVINYGQHYISGILMNRRQLLKYFTSTGLIPVYSVSQSFINAAPLPFNQTALVYDKAYLGHIMFEGHPESPERLLAVINLLEKEKLNQYKVDFKQIDANKIEDYIRLVHTDAHMQALKKRHSKSHTVLLKVISDIISVTRSICHGEYRNAFCATRPPGHHAENTGKIEGFCLYNNVAIAARYAQQYLNIQRVLIIDWDYHHGNGTESAFYHDPSVLFFSTHDWHAYPGTGDPGKTGEGEGQGLNVNVHLPCGTTDEMIIDAFQKKLIPAADKFEPELIIISAGFDSRKNDPLGCFNITDNGFTELTRLTMQLADKHCKGRILSVMEGGYNLQGNASAVSLHVKTLLTG